jgi:hypothetical protein
MKILDKLKNIFKKKEEKEFESLEEEANKVKEELVKEEYPICAKCNMTIFPEQRVKTFDNKKFHLKPCFRELMKEAKKEAFQ